MTTDQLGQQLHDKATRGEPLSAEEQAQLEQWYARHDQEESAALAGALPPQNLTALRARVDAAVAQLLIVTQRIQSLTAENENIRREVAALQRQLTQKPATQPA